MVVLHPPAAGGSAQQSCTPSFQTPRYFIKPEPIANLLAAAESLGMPKHGSAQQLGQSKQHQSNSAFNSTAQHSFEQQSKSEGAKSHPAVALTDCQSAERGLSFSSPQPLHRPFQSTVLERILQESQPLAQDQAAVQSEPDGSTSVDQVDSLAAADQLVTQPADNPPDLPTAGLPSGATGMPSADQKQAVVSPAGELCLDGTTDDDQGQLSMCLGSAQADSEAVGNADVQQEAAMAAAKAAEEAEQFALKALQSPQHLSSPGNKVSMSASLHEWTVRTFSLVLPTPAETVTP